ncbi:MAG: hypothetical protein ACOX9R_07380 [Armatimonadota bacterium]
MIRMQRSYRIHGSYTAIVAALALISAAAVAPAPAHAQDEPAMLEEIAEAPWALAARLHVTDPDTLALRIVFDRQDPANTHSISLTPGETFVERIVDGRATRIGYGRPIGTLEAGADLELTVRRDGWRIVFIVGREVLAQAWDRTLPDGGVGYTITGGELADALVQPIGPIYMTDDFMREDESASKWDLVAGSWETAALRVDEQSERMEIDKSVNAFSYMGTGADGPAIATTGYWFWTDYEVGAAVRALEADPLGLVAFYQDEDNYLLMRWTSALSEADDADRLQLVAVRDGQRIVLAEERGGHLPGQWYRLELRVCEGLVQGFVDGEPRLAAETDLFGQGQIGLYCEGETGTFFDSILVTDWEVLSEDFGRPAPGKWVERSGDWRYADGTLVATGEGSRVALTGKSDWERYWFEVAVEARGAVGIVACADESSWYGLRFGTRGSGVSYEGEAQIVRVDDGAETVLSSAPAHIPAGSSHRLKVVIDEGLITGYLDGKRVLDAYDAGATAGRIGLMADGAGEARFESVYLAMIPPRRIARVTKEFTEEDAHPEMAEWASTRAPWMKPEGDGDAWWTKGDYFGDKTIAFAIPGVEAAEGSVRLVLEGVPEEPGSGITLVLSTTGGASSLTATLLAGDETLAEQTVEVESDPCPVRFERKGTWVVATIDGNVVFNVKR